MVAAIQNNYSKYSLYLIGVASLLLIYFFMWRVDAIGYSSVVGGDGKDYYSYLMSIFIDKNLGHQDTSPWYVIQTATGTINVHTIGVSLLLLPFFAIACVWAQLSGYEVNGLSEPFEKMISLGALCYALIGLYFIRKLLVKQKTRDKVIAIVILLIFFGTNLLNYTINEPCMSHVYSFTLISAFLYLSYQIFNTTDKKYLIYTAIVFALILLVRSINGIVIFILPLWTNSLAEFREKIKTIITDKSNLTKAVVLFTAILMIQSMVWLFQNGKLIQWTYKDNGLYLLSPNTLKMLFGFNAGFFIYTPLCFLLLFGLIPMFKNQRYKFFVLSAFLLFVFYLFSCHWAYTYFDGLSIRALVDFYAVFALLGAILLNKLTTIKVKSLTGAGIALTVIFNLLFCYQYKAGILPPAGMNYAKFSYIFFKTDKKYVGVLGGCNDLLPYAKKHPSASFKYENTFNETEIFSYHENEFGVSYEVPQLGFATSKIYVTVELRRKESALNASQNALLVLHIEGQDKSTKNYQAYKLNDTPATTIGEWQTWQYAVTMDGKIEASDKLIIYVWNKERKEFYIDDFKVKVYNYNFNA